MPHLAPKDKSMLYRPGHLVAVLGICLALAGCGIKPDKLASPRPDDAPFPKTYPAAP